MKTQLRLALPPLAQLSPGSDLAFALFDRAGRLLRSGRLSVAEIASAITPDEVTAILHPVDAVVVSVDVPPIPPKRLEAAVQARIEPMTLTDIDDLCIAHGPRTSEGRVQVAWADRQLLVSAWRMLHEAGLRLASIVPSSLALPLNDPKHGEPLGLPVDDRWRAPLPKWSLARPEWRPATPAGRWRNAAVWATAAVVVWLLGINTYAVQLQLEMDGLRLSMEEKVRNAFPALPVILDPLRQARSQLDLLRQSNGSLAPDDFIPLAIGAAKVLSFAEGHVSSIGYRAGMLVLELADGYTPPSNESVLLQAAAAQSLTVRKDDQKSNTWYVSRNAGSAQPGVAR